MQSSRRSPKYRQIIATARRLFWKHGIRRVTVDEICNEAGASKMTFYRFFNSKTELARIVLDQIFEEALEKYRGIMAQDISFSEKIRQTIQLKLEGTADISQELIMDIYKNEEPELIAFMAEKRKQSTDEVMHSFLVAQRRGWLRKSLKPEFILYQLNKIHEMATDEVLLSMYPSPQAMIMELTSFFFYGISAADKETS